MDGNPRVVCLLGGGAERYLGLHVRDDDWLDYWRFLGVQGISDT
jgi:hypothetical protein